MGHFNGVECFSQSTDLVDLDEDGVAATQVNAFLEELDIGHEQVVTHELALVADLVREDLPTIPVTFITTVFDGVDGVLADQFSQVVGLFF